MTAPIPGDSNLDGVTVAPGEQHSSLFGVSTGMWRSSTQSGYFGQSAPCSYRNKAGKGKKKR